MEGRLRCSRIEVPCRAARSSPRSSAAAPPSPPVPSAARRGQRRQRRPSASRPPTAATATPSSRTPPRAPRPAACTAGAAARASPGRQPASGNTGVARPDRRTASSGRRTARRATASGAWPTRGSAGVRRVGLRVGRHGRRGPRPHGRGGHLVRGGRLGRPRRREHRLRWRRASTGASSGGLRRSGTGKVGVEGTTADGVELRPPGPADAPAPRASSAASNGTGVMGRADTGRSRSVSGAAAPTAGPATSPGTSRSRAPRLDRRGVPGRPPGGPDRPAARPGVRRRPTRCWHLQRQRDHRCGRARDGASCRATWPRSTRTSGTS